VLQRVVGVVVAPEAPDDLAPGAAEDARGVGVAGAAGAGALVDVSGPRRSSTSARVLPVTMSQAFFVSSAYAGADPEASPEGQAVFASHDDPCLKLEAEAPKSSHRRSKRRVPSLIEIRALWPIPLLGDAANPSESVANRSSRKRQTC
jgi:hypothetical protein